MTFKNFYFRSFSFLALLYFMFLTSAKLQAQGINIGVPPILNYVKERYEAGTHNWDIAQDKRGVIYFSNNEGLLEFDGSEWRTYQLENQTICRSVAIDQSGNIFVGGQGEFGSFRPDSLGVLKYESLIDFFPKGHENFEDVWDIVVLEDRLFFRTSRKIYQYVNNKIRVYILESDLLFMEKVGDDVWVQDNAGNLVRYLDDQFVPVLDSKLDIGIITGVVPFDQGRYLISTLKRGFFVFDGSSIERFETKLNGYLRENRITCLQRSDHSDEIILGTMLGGAIAIDTFGRAVRLFNKTVGLQSNNINSAFFDQSDNLWLGLSNGIDYVELNSPFTLIHPDGELEDPVYDVDLYNDKLYVGTSNGLYRIPWQDYYDPLSDIQFEIVENSSGQVWGIDVVDDLFLFGHHEGDFSLEGNKAVPVSPGVGGWKYLEFGEDRMISGCYTGLNLFSKNNSGSWDFDYTLRGFNESSRLIQVDSDNSIWVAHPYRGVFNVKLVPEDDSVTFKRFDSIDGLSSDLLNDVFKVNEEVVFTSEKGVFRFNNESNRFEPYEAFQNLIGAECRVKELAEDRDKNIWFVADEEVGMIHVKEKGLVKDFEVEYFPFLKDKLLGGFEMIVPVDAHNIFFGSDKGVYHFDPSKEVVKDSSFRAFITRVVYKSDLVFGGNYFHAGKLHFHQSEDQIKTFDHNDNAFQFLYSSNFYPDVQQVKYKYMLTGVDQDWSEWTDKKDKEYNNLSPGAHTFRLKAVDKYGNVSPVQEYSFIVKTAWYATRLAKTIWVGLIICIAGMIFLLQRTSHTRERQKLTFEQKEMEQKHRQEVKDSKNEIVELKNENFETQIQFKNKELASTTMHLVQKVEMIKTLQGELNKITNSDKGINDLKRDISKLIRMLNADEQLDNEWEQFAYHFDEVHSNFLKRISEEYPQLKPNDHRLCAYLRMNLSTKEIAHLLNLSVRGVEASRYRLRKKIGLDTEENLTEFMMRF
jgi:ligand-binding sensor domain-containing protein/DNA-binding CsgD family transcriptional regulator